MAKKKDKTTDEVVDVQEQEVLEQVEEVKEEAEVVEEVKAEEPIVEPKVESKEVQYKDRDIVEFYNNAGELRFAPYAYIAKRGYKAIGLYTKKK